MLAQCDTHGGPKLQPQFSTDLIHSLQRDVSNYCTLWIEVSMANVKKMRYRMSNLQIHA